MLYLDYDGVLHHHDVRTYRGRGLVLTAPGRTLFEWCDPLIEALAPYPEVVIRLSTTWVRELHFDRARAYLPPALRGRVIGATYHTDFDRDRPYYWESLTRYEQIKLSVERHRYVNWLAIDDLHAGEEAWPADEAEHLVRTDPERGVGDPAAQRRLREALARMMSGAPETSGTAATDAAGPLRGWEGAG